MRKHFLLLCCFFCWFHSALAQIDTVFWFAAPHTWVNTTQNFHIPIQFIVSNPNTSPATVTVEMPANPAFIPIVTIVAAGGVSFVNMTSFNAQIIHDIPNVVLNRGIKISSSQAVQVTYEVVSGFCECNPEIFTLKGKSGLGQLFYVPFQQSWPNDNLYSPQPVASFDIVATADSTLVQILPTTALVGRPAGVSFQIVLNRGQSYSATAATHLAGQRPSGSRVTSNKPVAITIKDDLVRPQSGFCADLTGDQLIPVSSYSKEYAVIRGALTIPDVIIIIPSVSGVPVLVNGVSVGITTAGVPISTTSAGAATYISSAEPFLVSHFSGFTCELGNAILPGLTCITGTEFQVPRRNNRAYRLQIIVPAGGQGGFRFNGAVGLFGAVSWLPVPGSANAYFYADILVTTAQLPALQVGRVSNLTQPFVLGVLHGFHTEGTRYAFYSNFSQYDPLEILSNKPDGRFCLGDSVVLRTNITMSVLWRRPNGSQQLTSQLQISSFSQSDTGWYVVSDSSACGPLLDSVYLSLIAPGQVNVTLLGNDTICAGDTVQLLLSRSGALQRVDLIDGAGNSLTITGNSVSLFNAGSYYVRWTDSCNVRDSSTLIRIVVLSAQTPDIQLSGTSICDDDSVRLLIRNYTPIGSYHLIDSRGVSNNLTDSVLFLFASGNYSIVHIVGNCSSSVVNFTIVGGVLNFGNISLVPDSILCKGDPVTLFVPQLAQGYQWYLNGVVMPNAIDSVFTSTERGVFEVEVRLQNPCVDTTFRLSRLILNHDIEASLQANRRKGVRPLQVDFSNSSIGATSYEWFKGDSLVGNQLNLSYLFESTGIYTIKLLALDSLFGCKDSTTTTIEVVDTLLIFIPNTFTPNGDAVNDRFRVYGEGFEEGFLAIYNRWGQLLFETSNWEEGWDGYINNTPAESGVYAYIFYYLPSIGERGVKSGVLKLIR
ncbi:MAG: gliding motility-associated C-terminal domain-containing protein [Sphingobacteriaceae bacterium]|nr:gliding motility-associated C-terminal domain-containing protein [Sphingobacteriaceae bacterium]